MTFDAERAVARTYDYSVVGECTAGCPLAATLSQHYSVLVLERGDSPYGDPVVKDFEGLFKRLGDPKNYPYVAEGFVSEDVVQLARGRLLGGGTAINGGFYSRASSEYVRKMKWNEKLVNKSFEWVEEENVFKPHKLFLGVLPSRTGFLKQELLLQWLYFGSFGRHQDQCFNF